MSDTRILFPDLLPSKLAAGEEYATVEQILLADDLPQATLHIPQWRVGGKPAAIRVRALSLTERDLALRQTTLTNQYCLAWQYGCMNPRFTAEQAAKLAEKNFHAIELGARFILVLSAIDQETIDRVVTAQTPAEPAPAAEPPAPHAAAADAVGNTAGSPADPA